jgi:hypothetical protein
LKLKKQRIFVEFASKMYAQSAFILKFMHILRKGAIVGLRETVHDYDDAVGHYISIIVSDRQFQCKGGNMFCKNASSLTWDEHPLVEPFNFLLDVLNGGGVEQAYIIKDDKETIVWTEMNGWMSSINMRKLFVPKGMSKRQFLCNDKATSLKCLCAKIAFDAQGPVRMREFKHYMDFEVQALVFKPCVWWVSL